MNFWEAKILEVNDLKQKLANNFPQKESVFTNGCFDILHYGHLCYLSEAKQLGDCLVVALNSDKSLEKVKNRKSYMILKHRLALVAAIGFVDFVTWFDKDNPNDLLKIIKPHILVKGGDYTLEQVIGADFVRSYGGKIFVTGYQKSLSSSLFFKEL